MLPASEASRGVLRGALRRTSWYGILCFSPSFSERITLVVSVVCFETFLPYRRLVTNKCLESTVLTSFSMICRFLILYIFSPVQ